MGDDITRPGPASIEPGAAPGGVVIHCYTADAEQRLLYTQSLTPDLDPETLDAMATEGGDIAAATDADVCLVAYDGDTGERMGPQIWLYDILLQGRAE